MADIVVTGAAGQVGTELCRLAAPGPASAIIGFGSQALDVTNVDQVAAVVRQKPAAVINCAAFTAVDAAEDAAAEAHRVNAHGAGNLARICADFDVPLVHVSTDYVFDGAASAPIDETSEPRPVNVYGRSKLAGERAVTAAGGCHAIIRAGWIFGRLQRGFVHTMLSLAATRDELRVVDDQHGVPCWAGHLAETLLQVAARLPDELGMHGTFHFTSAPATTWCGFAREIVAAGIRAGRLPADAATITAIPTTDYPTRAERPRYTVLNGARLSTLLDAEPPAWREGLELCLAATPR